MNVPLSCRGARPTHGSPAPTEPPDSSRVGQHVTIGMAEEAVKPPGSRTRLLLQLLHLVSPTDVPTARCNLPSSRVGQRVGIGMATESSATTRLKDATIRPSPKTARACSPRGAGSGRGPFQGPDCLWWRHRMSDRLSSCTSFLHGSERSVKGSECTRKGSERSVI